MTEAVDEMVKCLTAEEFKGKLLVILAGYEKDMEGMLATNPGKSCFLLLHIEQKSYLRN